ncbi:MAG TPA: DNA-3-methyladenine glycosylase [Candidatus Dormibacteraeota bacterium]|nr:DNA-3-methyladenine glycosylase [Candidatus Dormibacteraeota bacterium]
MPSGLLGRDFFARPTPQVARELIGCRLVVDRGGADEVVATLVEVEAYLGLADPASHAHRGPTPRAAIMFGPAGHLYVYLSYGVHHCANLVTESDGVAGAVLLRSAVVESGEAAVRARRGAYPVRRAVMAAGTARVIPHRDLLRGPGNLCRGLAIDLAGNGLDVVSAASRLEVFAGDHRVPIVSGPRVGISSAMDRPLRFAWRDHPSVSNPPLTG